MLFLHTLQLQLHEGKSCQSHLVCQCQNLQIKYFVKWLCKTTFDKAVLIYPYEKCLLSKLNSSLQKSTYALKIYFICNTSLLFTGIQVKLKGLRKNTSSCTEARDCIPYYHIYLLIFLCKLVLNIKCMKHYENSRIC